MNLGEIMNMEQLAVFLAWCTVFNFAVLTLWGVLFIFGRNWMYSIHSRWYKLSNETFDRCHYKGMMYYKVSILFLNLIPYLVIRLFLL